MLIMKVNTSNVCARRLADDESGARKAASYRPPALAEEPSLKAKKTHIHSSGTPQ